MKRWLLLLLLVAGNASAADFTVEQKLHDVPEALAKYVRAHADYTDFRNGDKPCAFVGKQVALADGVSNDAWILTTKDACAWGAAAGPVIVVHVVQDGYQLLLDTTGYDVILGKVQPNTLRNIAVGGETAARQQFDVFGFDGEKYVVRLKAAKEMSR